MNKNGKYAFELPTWQVKKLFLLYNYIRKKVNENNKKKYVKMGSGTV